MTEDLNELRAKAAALDELERELSEIRQSNGAPADEYERGLDNGYYIAIARIGHLTADHRQRINVTPDPQVDNDYEPENGDELVLIKKGTVPSWMTWCASVTASVGTHVEAEAYMGHEDLAPSTFLYRKVPDRLSTNETTEDKQ